MIVECVFYVVLGWVMKLFLNFFLVGKMEGFWLCGFIYVVVYMILVIVVILRFLVRVMVESGIFSIVFM